MELGQVLSEYMYMFMLRERFGHIGSLIYFI